MKNSADLGGCYPPRSSASVDNTLLDLQNSSYPTQPNSIIAKYINCLGQHIDPKLVNIFIQAGQINRSNLKSSSYWNTQIWLHVYAT